MRIEICQSYEALSLKAKEIVTSELGQHKALTLCAATGGSPTRMYELLVEEAGRQPELFSQFTVLKLDEWGGIPMDHPGTCESYLRNYFVGPLQIPEDRYIAFQSDPENPEAECERIPCPLFGDACGAVLLEPTTEEFGVLDTILRTDGVGYPHLIMKSGGSAYPPSHETVDNREHFVYQDGRVVFKYAVSYMADVAAEIAEKNGLTHDDIAWIVPHQANLRIIDATAKRLGVDMDKVMINIQKYGNTSAGTIPICLWEWENQLKKGDNLILAAFGAGFTWGAVYLKWGYDGKKA